MNNILMRPAITIFALIMGLLLVSCGGQQPTTRPSMKIQEPQVFAESKCGTLERHSWYQTKCYWEFAMTNKNPQICDDLPNSPKEIIVALAENDPDFKYAQSVREYTYKNNCKDSIHYLNNGSEWNLKEGIPPFADPQALIYSGEATLKGWGKYEPEFEGNDSVLFFYLTQDSIQALPPAFQKFKAFKLLGINTEESPVWEQYTEENPITITAKELKLLMEGAPTLNFVETP